ncbi:hypothetical protein B0T17DRAFT_403137 [Bombardia bombarda]|uniref:Uncharacterized protein n=1 Tax=Bombardia bombarda TaxID=252184 RepID=A0AA39WBI2_9PEZI|nr:hypothetical protein B0T17DRAFT_403137 [Bombardia bombarda]
MEERRICCPFVFVSRSLLGLGLGLAFGGGGGGGGASGPADAGGGAIAFPRLNIFLALLAVLLTAVMSLLVRLSMSGAGVEKLIGPARDVRRGAPDAEDEGMLPAQSRTRARMLLPEQRDWRAWRAWRAWRDCKTWNWHLDRPVPRGAGRCQQAVIGPAAASGPATVVWHQQKGRPFAQRSCFQVQLPTVVWSTCCLSVSVSVSVRMVIERVERAYEML